MFREVDLEDPAMRGLSKFCSLVQGRRGGGPPILRDERFGEWRKIQTPAGSSKFKRSNVVDPELNQEQVPKAEQLIPRQTGSAVKARYS